jgi:hypothetical protein
MANQIISTHTIRTDDSDETSRIHAEHVECTMYQHNGTFAQIDSKFRWTWHSTGLTFRPLRKIIGFDSVTVRTGPDKETIEKTFAENLVDIVRKQTGKEAGYQSIANVMFEKCSDVGQDPTPVLDKFHILFADYYTEHLK